MTGGQPPLSGLVRALLRLLLGARDARTLFSELQETYELRRDREGPAPARAWLRREGRRAVAHAALERLRPGKSGTIAGFLRELRHAARRLVRAPAFALTVVLTVGLGVGGTTAVFAVVHGVLIAPLPYPEPDEIVNIYTEIPGQDWGLSMADYVALEEQQTTLEETAFSTRGYATLSTPEGAERIEYRAVTPSFFRLLGIDPPLGRGFTEEEAEPGGERVAVVSWEFWQTRLGSDPGAVGRTIRLDGDPVPVVGVLPRRPDPLTARADLLVPLPVATPPRKGPFGFLAIARIRDTQRGAAAQELAAIENRIFPIWQDSWPRPDATWGMQDLKTLVVGDTGPALWIMLGAVGFLLLIACVNTANLLVARGLGRRQELAVRAALGASRGRLLGYALSESAVLAVLSTGAALGIAVAGTRLAATYGSDFIPRTGEIGITPPVLLFLGATTLGALVLFGLIPALGSRRVGTARHLGSSGRGASTARGASRLRQGLVVGQFAVTAPLLVGAALLLISLNELRGVDPGFDSHRILSARVVLPSGAYSDPAERWAAWERLERRVAAIPGVDEVGVGTGRPPDHTAFSNNFVVEDRPVASGEAQPASPWVVAEPGYFRALGVDVVEGRMFDPGRDPPRVLLVDQAWARRFFPEDTPVGRRIRHGACTRPECDPWTIIGVVEDVRYRGLDRSGEGTVYMSFSAWGGNDAYLFVRSRTGEPGALAPALRRVVGDEEPGAPITELATGDQLLSSSLKEPRYLSLLVAGFAALALILALVGIYGVMAYFVQDHRKEMSIRLALGGEPGALARLVLGSALRLAAGGTVVGVAAGLVLSGSMEALLFGVASTDPAPFVGVAALLVGVAAAAAAPPALRATRVEPARVLREE